MPILKVKPRLKQILKAKKMTQEELAERTKVPQGSISRFDSRTRHEASHIFSIAYALGVKVEDLFQIEKEEG